MTGICILYACDIVNGKEHIHKRLMVNGERCVKGGVPTWKDINYRNMYGKMERRRMDGCMDRLIDPVELKW